MENSALGGSMAEHDPNRETAYDADLNRFNLRNPRPEIGNENAFTEDEI